MPSKHLPAHQAHDTEAYNQQRAGWCVSTWSLARQLSRAEKFECAPQRLALEQGFANLPVTIATWRPLNTPSARGSRPVLFDLGVGPKP